MAASTSFASIAFTHVAPIRPVLDAAGRPATYEPEPPAPGVYRHREATGPFGRFEVPGAPDQAGVFAITGDGTLFYVGETSNLARLAGPLGFGVVTRGKLAPNGPSTNCRINRLLLQAIQSGKRVDLWLHRADRRSDRIALRNRIIANEAPSWNRRSTTAPPVTGRPPAAPRPDLPREGEAPTTPQSERREFAGSPAERGFSFVGLIDPEREPDGRVIEDQPHLRFANSAGHRLGEYGAGPFCRFSVRGTTAAAGIYAIAVNDEIVYVGECVSLSERYGPRGYGAIHPRNCFAGGQSTNCRINHLILRAAASGATCALWFREIPDRVERLAAEAELIRSLSPSWNRKGRVSGEGSF